MKNVNEKEQLVDQVDEDTFLVTAQEYEKKLLEQAVKDFENKRGFHSAYLNDPSGSIHFKIEEIDNLAYNAQSDINKIIQINNIIRYFVNKDGILGKLYESIEANVNSYWDLTYPKFNEKEKNNFKLVDELIRDFNNKIDLESLITTSIPMTYLEGNYPMYLRKNIKERKYQVDYYPLGVCEVSDYSFGSDPYLLINIKELESRLKKNYRKNRKNKPLFYENMDAEIRNAYPEEVVRAFRDKEQYAKLNIENTGLLRINNLNRKYGLSPIFKSLKDAIRLENIELSDDKNILVRGKKIIFQKLRKELITEHKDLPNITWSSAVAKAHLDLLSALNQKGISVFTGLPWTESIEYIEPQLEPTNVQTKNVYKHQIMTSLGISYLDASKGSYGAAQISIKELIKVINRISEQLEKVLEKWYRGLIRDIGLDPDKYCPKIKILDSEKLDTELSIKLAKMLYNELNASLETVYNTLGFDVHTEARRRKMEKELGYEEIFEPRKTAYTNSSRKTKDEEVGNPRESQDPDKKDYDKNYNDENNR